MFLILFFSQACRNKGVDCIVAPYEADAQLAYMMKCGIAQLVITEDSDLVLFGCDRVSVYIFTIFETNYNYRPRSEASEGYVFTGICLSNGGGGVDSTKGHNTSPLGQGQRS